MSASPLTSAEQAELIRLRNDVTALREQLAAALEHAGHCQARNTELVEARRAAETERDEARAEARRLTEPLPVRCEAENEHDGALCTRFKGHAKAHHFGDDEKRALWGGMTYWYRVATEDQRRALSAARAEIARLTGALTEIAKRPPDCLPGCDCNASRARAALAGEGKEPA